MDPRGVQKRTRGNAVAHLGRDHAVQREEDAASILARPERPFQLRQTSHDVVPRCIARGGHRTSGDWWHRVYMPNDSERIFESGLRLSYAIIPKARLFVDYQKIHVDFDGGGDGNIDDDLRIGFEAKF
jgi:hypothetical protein